MSQLTAAIAAVTGDAPRHLCAADGNPYNYPIPDGALLFRDKCLARLGEFSPFVQTAAGEARDNYDFDDELFSGFERNYDPRFFAARAYFDHPLLNEHLGCDGPHRPTPAYGPTPGLVLAVRYAQAAGELRGDVLALDWYFGHCLTQGMLPDCSIEWFDHRLCDGALFYGRFPFYLTGLAALGVVRPAIPATGPWPEPVVVTAGSDCCPRDIPYVLPLAAQHVALAAQKSLPPSEVPMSGTTTGAPAGAQAPPDAGALAAAQAENEQLKAQLAAQQGDKTSLTAAAYDAIKAENAALKQQLQADSDFVRVARLDKLCAAQYEAGHLTAASEPAFRAAAQLAIELDREVEPARKNAALAVAQASVPAGAQGAGKVTAATGLLDLVLALAAHLPGQPTGAQAGVDHVQQREGDGTAPAVEVTERDEAAARASGGKYTAAQMAYARVHNGQLPPAQPQPTTEGAK